MRNNDTEWGKNETKSTRIQTKNKRKKTRIETKKG